MHTSPTRCENVRRVHLIQKWTSESIAKIGTIKQASLIQALAISDKSTADDVGIYILAASSPYQASNQSVALRRASVKEH